MSAVDLYGQYRRFVGQEMEIFFIQHYLPLILNFQVVLEKEQRISTVLAYTVLTILWFMKHGLVDDA